MLRGAVYSTATEVINQCLIGKGKALVANVKNTHFQNGALLVWTSIAGDRSSSSYDVKNLAVNPRPHDVNSFGENSTISRNENEDKISIRREMNVCNEIYLQSNFQWYMWAGKVHYICRAIYLERWRLLDLLLLSFIWMFFFFFFSR